MKKILLLFISLTLLPSFLYADGTATVTLDPENPAPYEQVTVTLMSYSFDVDNAMIKWTVDGKKVSQGVGIKSISLVTKGGGQSIPVSVQAQTADGDIFTSTLQITPESVDLLWETPESYTPPFYEGKSLPGEESVVRVTALPSLSEGKGQIAASNLSYSWYVNDDYVDTASGRGKQSANLKLDYLREKTEIKVRVRSPRGSIAEKTITIIPHPVMPLMYTYDDTLGINFSQLLTRRFETAQQTTLALVPFYLSAKGGLEQSASYEWYLDGLPVTPQEKTLLGLRPKDNSMGVKNLSILIANTARRLQKAESTLTIVFDTRK